MPQIYLAHITFNKERGRKCRYHMTDKRMNHFYIRCKSRAWKEPAGVLRQEHPFTSFLTDRCHSDPLRNVRQHNSPGTCNVPADSNKFLKDSGKKKTGQAPPWKCMFVHPDWIRSEGLIKGTFRMPQKASVYLNSARVNVSYAFHFATMQDVCDLMKRRCCFCRNSRRAVVFICNRGVTGCSHPEPRGFKNGPTTLHSAAR